MKTNILVFILSLMCLTSCYAARIDGPYEGKVIDADTGQPIEGVVVLGTWHSITVTPAGGTSKFYDVQETATDKDGYFKIKGLGLAVLSNIEPPYMTIFKAGYSYDNLFWIPGELSLYTKMKWEGKRAIIPIKKLSMEERSKNIPPPPPGRAPKEKVILMLKEMDKDLEDQGLESFREKSWR